MQFTNPFFLWALTGLTIPIGIHLLSRKEGKVIRLGSIRHVQETSTQQFRGIRLNEKLLLILRCLLIILFTLIISGLHWNDSNKKNWLVVEKGLEVDPVLKPMLDSLINEGYELHLLKDGFPIKANDDSTANKVNYWSLIEKLQSKNLGSVIVFAQNRAENFKGLRSSLPENIRWISQPSDEMNYTLETLRLKNDSVFRRVGHTNVDATFFTTEKVVGLPIETNVETMDTIHITMASDSKYENDLKMIKAALAAIRKSFPVILKVNEIKTTDRMPAISYGWLVWLSDKKFPEGDFKILYTLPDLASHELFLQEKPDQWTIARRLNEEVALNENLTLNLASLLIAKEKLQDRANSNDRRMISDSIVWGAVQRESIKAGIDAQPANPYLILLLLALLIAERSVAYKRNQ